MLIYVEIIGSSDIIKGPLFNGATMAAEAHDRLDALEESVDKWFNALEESVDKRFNALEERFDGVEKKLQNIEDLLQQILAERK
jgi:tetrahydromethanopterin S-methyltransferase subunit G